MEHNLFIFNWFYFSIHFSSEEKRNLIRNVRTKKTKNPRINIQKNLICICNERHGDDNLFIWILFSGALLLYASWRMHIEMKKKMPKTKFNRLKNLWIFLQRKIVSARESNRKKYMVYMSIPLRASISKEERNNFGNFLREKKNKANENEKYNTVTITTTTSKVAFNL